MRCFEVTWYVDLRCLRAAPRIGELAVGVESISVVSLGHFLQNEVKEENAVAVDAFATCRRLVSEASAASGESLRVLPFHRNWHSTATGCSLAALCVSALPYLTCNMRLSIPPLARARMEAAACILWPRTCRESPWRALG